MENLKRISDNDDDDYAVTELVRIFYLILFLIASISKLNFFLLSKHIKQIPQWIRLHISNKNPNNRRSKNKIVMCCTICGYQSLNIIDKYKICKVNGILSFKCSGISDISNV